MAHSRIPVSLVAVPTLILSDSQDLPFTRSFIENVTKALHGKVWKATNVSKSDMLTWLMNKEGPWTSKRLFLAVFQHKFIIEIDRLDNATIGDRLKGSHFKETVKRDWNALARIY
eukprot:CAMPEP_0184660290 /NCGR_PEP_ID=MMETSP0308-20130426/33366_1 /TAXON_ID=38269 /ORGANISM="Gloeochaete witrockiana, Strain SAG 46.84" /LENGTH=114 /DNA_ID=CAMNT_0027100781 /DNA_START=266 /DNA_END=611 /DNA_ORIENTATION=+